MLKLYLALGWAGAGAIIYLSLTSLPDTGIHFRFMDKVMHLGAYFSLAAWFGFVCEKRRNWWIHAAVFVLMGAGLEIAQGLGGIRQAELADALANLSGVVLAGLLWPWTKGWLQGIEEKLFST